MPSRTLVPLLDTAVRRGARAAEVLAIEHDGTTAEVEAGRVLSYGPAQRRSVRLRVYLPDGRVGVATAPEAGDTVVEAALRAAEGSAPDPHAGPAPRPHHVPLRLGVDDRRWGALGRAERVEVLLAAEAGVVQGDRRARPGRFRYDDARVVRRFASTRGVTLDEAFTCFCARGSIDIGDDGALVRLTDEVDARSFATIAALPFGQALAERGARLLGAPASVDGPIRVALPPVEVGRIFAHLGAGLIRGGFPVLRERPLDPRVHLLDDGTLPGSLRSTAFDDRGCVPQPVVLIREGRVGPAARTPEEARRRDLLPTGHVHGDVLRPNNLYLRGGTRTCNAILLETDRPVLHIDHLEGVEDGIDEQTGDLRFKAWGWLGHGAKRGPPVRGLRLRGTLHGVFGKIVDLCVDTDRFFHVDAPAMIVDGLVAG